MGGSLLCCVDVQAVAVNKRKGCEWKKLCERARKITKKEKIVFKIEKLVEERKKIMKIELLILLAVLVNISIGRKRTFFCINHCEMGLDGSF